MNERIQLLRQMSLETHPSLSIERAVLLTQAYKKYEGRVSTPVLRALSFYHLLQNKSICIHEGELIVGERGPTLKATPTYPELCCHAIEDLEIIHNRGQISFTVTPEVKRIQQVEIIPFWHHRSMRTQIFQKMHDSWKDCYQAGLFTEFMEQRSPGHTVADGKVFAHGLLDVKERIRQQLEALYPFPDEPSKAKKEQLKAMDIVADAMILFANRYGEEARKKAHQTADVKRKNELLRIAKICSYVPRQAPRDFWEALQSYWFIHLGVITELNPWDAFNPGRLDQHLYPFYKKGLEEGTVTQKTARELLQAFWIKFNNQPAPPKVGVTLQESSTYTDFANINIGGLKADGSHGINPVSYLLLEVIDEMRLTQPSSNIQLSKKTPEHFLQKACEVIRSGWGQPSLFNADAVVMELLRQGKSLEDARNGGTSGCVETGAFGKESYILTGYFNLVKVLELTLQNGWDSGMGKQLGLKTGDPVSFTDFDALLQAYERQLQHFMDIKIQGNKVIERLYAHSMPAPFLSLFIDDCIEKGQDYHGGGSRYNTRYLQGVGIGTLTDSFSALKYHLFHKKTMRMAEMLEGLQSNFKGKEKLRQILLHKTPKYGNDDDYPDELMVTLFNLFFKEVDGRPTETGGVYRINMLPTTCHVYFGSCIGATPDGRKAGQPLSEGISPVQGMDKKGPTAVLKSAAKMDHIKTGGTLLNQKFTPALVEDEVGIKQLSHLIRAYFCLDGHHIQFNIIDADTLRKAQENPESYGHLIVRVAGYSDYFCHLNRDLQDEIIARTEHQTF